MPQKIKFRFYQSNDEFALLNMTFFDQLIYNEKESEF